MKYKLVASIYDSVEKIYKNAEKDWALDIKSCSEALWVEADNVHQAMKNFCKIPVIEKFLDEHVETHILCIEEEI